MEKNRMALTPMELKRLPDGSLVRLVRNIGIDPESPYVPKGRTYVVGHDISFEKSAITMTFELVRYPEES